MESVVVVFSTRSNIGYCGRTFRLCGLTLGIHSLHTILAVYVPLSVMKDNQKVSRN